MVRYSAGLLSFAGPNPQGAFEVRYAVWSLIIAINFMVNHNAYRNWHFTLKWQGHVVLTLWFIATMTQKLDRGSAASWRKMAKSTLIATSILDDADTANLSFELLYGFRSVDLSDAMMVIVGGLSWTAPHPEGLFVDSSSFRGDFPSYKAIYRPASRSADSDVSYQISLGLTIRMLARTAGFI